MKPVILMIPKDTKGLSITFITESEDKPKVAQHCLFMEDDIRKVLLDPRKIK